MSQIDRSQLIPDPQQPNRQPGGIQSPRPIAPAHGQQHGAANTSPRPNQGQHQQRQQYQQHQQRSANGAGHNQGPSHTRVSNNRDPADNRSAKGNKTGGKTAFFVVLGLVAIVYIVGVVAFSQIAYPNTTIAGVDISFSNASSAATKVNSAWKHYKLTVSGEDFSWTYQPESDEPIVNGEAAAHEIIGSNEPLLWPSRLIASLGGKNVSTTKNATIDLEQDVDLSMLSDTFDQKQFEEDLGAAIDAFNEGRSGTFEASSSYDEQAGKFTVEKARSNEKLNREHVIKYAELELASLAESVDITKIGNDAYEPLNGTLTDDQIQAACDAANNFLGVNVTLRLNGNDAGKVDGSSVLQWISFADPANPTLDTSQISSWAADLANGFNTWAPPVGGRAPMASNVPSKAVTLVGLSIAARLPSRSRTLSTTSRPARLRSITPRRPTPLPPRASPIGRRISTSTCPSSTRATMTRTGISCGRPTVVPANRAKTPPRRVCGRSTATTAQASSSVLKTPRPESPNTRARSAIGCRSRAI